MHLQSLSNRSFGCARWTAPAGRPAMPPPLHCQGHISQCLGRILACCGDATVAAAGPGGRRLSGAEFVDGVEPRRRPRRPRGAPGPCRRRRRPQQVPTYRTCREPVSRSGRNVVAFAEPLLCLAYMCSVEYVQLFLAVTYAGAIIAPLNYRWVRTCTSPVLLSLIQRSVKVSSPL